MWELSVFYGWMEAQMENILHEDRGYCWDLLGLLIHICILSHFTSAARSKRSHGDGLEMVKRRRWSLQFPSMGDPSMKQNRKSHGFRKKENVEMFFKIVAMAWMVLCMFRHELLRHWPTTVTGSGTYPLWICVSLLKSMRMWHVPH